MSENINGNLNKMHFFNLSHILGMIFVCVLMTE